MNMKEKGLVKKAFEVIRETVGLPSYGTILLNMREDMISVTLLTPTYSEVYYSQAFYSFDSEQVIDKNIEEFKEAYAEFKKLQKRG